MTSGPKRPIDTDFSPIDNTSAMPLFLQIVGQFEAALRTRRILPSDMLPAEPILCEQFGVSRKTLRRATDHLTRLGLIRRIHGVGTVVTEEAWIDGFSAVRSIYDDLISARRTPETRLLSQERVIVDAALSESTGFEVGTDVLSLVRLRLADGRPVAVLENIVLSKIGAIGEDEINGSFLELMKQRGLHSHIIKQEITARFPAADQIELLDVAPGTPILCEIIQSIDADGAMLNYSSNFYHPLNHRMKAVTFVSDSASSAPGGLA